MTENVPTPFEAESPAAAPPARDDSRPSARDNRVLSPRQPEDAEVALPETAPEVTEASTPRPESEEQTDPQVRQDHGSVDRPDSAPAAREPTEDGGQSRGIAELSATIEQLGQRIDELQKTVSQSAALQEHQASMVQKLHAENQTLRQGELTQALKPIILDIARLHDDVERVISRGGDALAKAAPIPEFIIDVLDRHGVTQIAPTPGEPFDSKLHQGLKVVETSEQTQDGVVESVIRPGFIRDGAHLVRPAQVVVYRYSVEASLDPVVPTQPVTAMPADPGSGSGSGGPPTVTNDAEATAAAGAAATNTDQAGSNDVG
jgi:molecular chaperone GrpE (heat shock protein)